MQISLLCEAVGATYYVDDTHNGCSTYYTWIGIRQMFTVREGRINSININGTLNIHIWCTLQP